MKVLKRVQNLPVNPEQAWQFFSSPKNLKMITPYYMGFDITSDYQGEEMYQGMIITYRVSPFFKIPLNWVTEISHVREPWYFVDNQVSGPFKLWHHQHIFKEIDGGIEMTDIVNYAVPFSPFLLPVEHLIVRKRVEEIFDFRYTKLIELFGKY